MFKLPANRWAIAAVAIFVAALLFCFYAVFGALAIAFFGAVLAAATALADKKLDGPRVFFSVSGIAVAFGGALVGHFETRRAQSETRTFQAGVSSAARDLSAKTDEISGLAKQVLELSRQNTELSSGLARKSQVIADLSRSLAFPLQGAIRAEAVIEIPGRQQPVQAFADQLHQKAFPNGNQAYGYYQVAYLDSKDPAQSALARFVSELALNFVFCSTAKCGFESQTFYPRASQGVEMSATASFGPEEPFGYLGPAIIDIAAHVQVRFVVNQDCFDIFLRSEPLKFVQLADAVPDSGRLQGRYVFFEGPLPVPAGIHAVVKSLAFRRSDGRLLAPERLESTGGSALPYYHGRLDVRWR